MYEVLEASTTRLALAGGWWTFSALLVAAVAGAVHAFAPGHGKALAAGYFASSGSSRADAARYALTVALMHTFSGMLLGLGLFGAASTLAHGWFAVLRAAAAGALILLGLVMLARVRSSRAAPGPLGLVDGSEHGHSHAPARPDVRLLALAGGLIPSPAVTATLLALTAAGRPALAVGMLFAAGAGMALSMFAVASAFRAAPSLLARSVPTSRLLPLLPVVSALVVLSTGVLLAWGLVSSRF